MDGRLRVGACLSLSGKFGQFGRQAARGLEAWRSLDGDADLVIEDDGSDKRTLEAGLSRAGRTGAMSSSALTPPSWHAQPDTRGAGGSARYGIASRLTWDWVDI